MKNSMVMFIFFCFLTVSTLFGDKFSPKSQNCCWRWNLAPRIIWICRIRQWFSFFELIRSRKSKFLVYAEIWCLDFFEYVNLDGDSHFSIFDLFLQVLSKKSIWNFDITELISQRFTRRDSKPVAFLHLIKHYLRAYESFYEY